jgi:hypothetical protein
MKYLLHCEEGKDFQEFQEIRWVACGASLGLQVTRVLISEVIGGPLPVILTVLKPSTMQGLRTTLLVDQHFEAPFWMVQLVNYHESGPLVERVTWAPPMHAHERFAYRISLLKPEPPSPPRSAWDHVRNPQV